MLSIHLIIIMIIIIIIIIIIQKGERKLWEVIDTFMTLMMVVVSQEYSLSTNSLRHIQ